jgi:lactoylglutathione lyase
MPGVSLSLLVLKTRQMDRLRAFYGSLGVQFLEERHGNGPVHYAGRIGDAVLEVYPLRDDGTPPDTTTRLGFMVEKVNEVVEALQANGHMIVTQPRETEWGYRAVVCDPDGRAVELYQR